MFGTLAEPLQQILTIADVARLRVMDKIAKRRKGARNPAREYTFVELIKVWVKYGQRPSVIKGGPLYRFYFEEERKALEDWATHVMAIVEGKEPAVALRGVK